MSVGAIVLAWGLSVAPFLLGTVTGGELRIEGASRFGLALLPWLALAGLPRSAEGEERPGWIGICALALPPLALGAGLDLAAGLHHPVSVMVIGLGGIALLALLGAAAGIARREAKARSAHAALWFVLLPGSAALLAALGWIGAPGPGEVPGTFEELARWNPLVWIHRATGEGAGINALLRPLCAGLLLLGAAVLFRGREDEEGAP